MAFREVVEIFIDTKVDSAKSQISGLKQSIGQAEGAVGKLKAAASGIGNAVGSFITSPAGLAAAGTAIAGVAAKSVMAFQDLGLAVGKMRDATGLAAEDASRWIEVAGDAGVETEAFATSVGRLEKNLETNQDALKEFGVEVVKAADGTVDMNATLLNAFEALNRIEDPTKRAAAGAAIFGKSWADMSELVTMGSDGLTKALAAVGDQKVLSDADVRSARELRDAIDSMKDAAEELALKLGKSLAPAITDVAAEIGPLIDLVGLAADSFNAWKSVKIDLPGAKDFKPFLGAIGMFTQSLDLMKNQFGDTPELKGNLDQISAATEGVGTTAANSVPSVESLAKANKTLEERARDAADALRDEADVLAGQAGAFTDAADDQLAYNEAVAEFNEKNKDSKASMEEVRDAAIEAAKGHQALYESLLDADGATATATGKVDAQNQSLLESARTASPAAQQGILDYIGSLNGIPPEKMTDIKAAIVAGDLETAQRLLDEASAPRRAAIEADAKTAQADKELDALAAKKRTAYIDAVLRDFGLKPAGTSTGGPSVNPGSTVVNVTMPRGANGRELDAALARYARTNGRIQALRR